MSRNLTAYLKNLPQKYKEELDLTFRLSFLEGVAGRPPGDWCKTPRQGAGEASEWFVNHEIPMDPSWFQMGKTTWAMELDRRVRGYVYKFQEDLAAIGIEAGDIINDLVAATTSTAGERKEKVFFSFGLSARKDLDELSTMTADVSVIDKGMTRAVWQYIRDNIKSPKNRPMTQGPTKRQLGPSDKGLEFKDQMERAMDLAPEQGRDPDHILLDLMSEELGANNPILQLADAAIDRLTPPRKPPADGSVSSWELARFTLKKFFNYMMDPRFNTLEVEPGKKDKRPNRAKTYAMMTNIREQVRKDILEEFDPGQDLTPEDRKKLVTRLYDIIGSGGRGKNGEAGIPSGIERVLEEIRKTPAVSALIERHQQEQERLTLRTAGIVWTYKFRKMKASLGLLGSLIFEPSSAA